MNRLITQFVLTLISISFIYGQEEFRPYYWQFGVNTAFGQVIQDHPEINARYSPAPSYFIGVGHFVKMRKNLYLDLSANYTGVKYALTTKFGSNESSVGIPVVTADLRKIWAHDPQKMFLTSNIGVGVSYSYDYNVAVNSYSAWSNSEFQTVLTRKSGVGLFANAGLGVVFKGKFRSILVGLEYSQGFIPTIDMYGKLNIYSDGKTYTARVDGKDSRVTLLMRIYFKNKNRFRPK
jgi:hypothetical protein